MDPVEGDNPTPEDTPADQGSEVTPDDAPADDAPADDAPADDAPADDAPADDAPADDAPADDAPGDETEEASADEGEAPADEGEAQNGTPDEVEPPTVPDEHAQEHDGATLAPDGPPTEAQDDTGLLLSPMALFGFIGIILVVGFVITVVLRRQRDDYHPTKEQLEQTADPRVEPSPPLTDEVPRPESDAETTVPIKETEVPVAVPEEEGLVSRLRTALGRSREALQGRFDQIFGKPVDDELFEALEETLIRADVGYDTTTKLIESLRKKAETGADAEALRAQLRQEMLAILTALDSNLAEPGEDLQVILVVGVNGSGKTTTIGKLAARYVHDGKRVLLAAGDTFRAAAGEQLAIWAERSGSEIVRHPEGADPGAVVYDALDAASARDVDVVIIDTAGRLQTRKPLMEQLAAKIRRVIQKKVEDAPHETLLVVDGTMGQNALSQAKLFDEATPLTGVAVTKLDGTAKGGMILTIGAELKLPVKLIGIGEQVDDLRLFEAEAFIEALT